MNFGKITVPTKWEEVTLKQFTELLTIYDKENKDILDIISMFTGRDKDELRKYPMDFINEILIHLQFMNTPLNIKPSNWVEIDGKKYSVNYMEKLKFGEFVDVETIIKDNKYNYPAILGILCRMEGEVYDDDFIAEKLNDRVKMFEELDMPSAMRLINFFFKVKSEIYSLYPKVFGNTAGQGTGRIVSPVYKRFSEGWGFEKVRYDLCEDRIEKVGEISQIYLTTVLQFMSYMNDKSIAEKA